MSVTLERKRDKTIDKLEVFSFNPPLTHPPPPPPRNDFPPEHPVSQIVNREITAKSLPNIRPRSPVASPTFHSSVWEDWSGRGSHVDFRRHETLPLVAGRELGDGRNGFVHETHCKGVALAWKRQRCRGQFGPLQRREIEILKRLSHHHIVKLVGTYTHRDILGMLLWPVAVCDLATLFDDMEFLHHQKRLSAWEGRRETLTERMKALGYHDFDSAHPHKWEGSLRSKLFSLIGCLAGAVEFLHSKEVRHKDLKPANVLILENGMRLSDFDMSTDFSVLSSSNTENGERGTPKYFAPEMAAYRPCGRAADIFALGCIFIELMWVGSAKCLDHLKALRPSQDQSYHLNLQNIHSWLDWTDIHDEEKPPNRHFKHLVSRMLQVDPARRPTAAEVVHHVRILSQLSFDRNDVVWYRPCCDPAMEMENVEDEIQYYEAMAEEERQAAEDARQLLVEGDAAREKAQEELFDVLMILADLEEKHKRDKNRLRELGQIVSDDESNDDEFNNDENDNDRDYDDASDQDSIGMWPAVSSHTSKVSSRVRRDAIL